MRNAAAFLTFTLLLAAPAGAESDTTLADWTHDGTHYVAMLKAGSLVVRENHLDDSYWTERGLALSDINCAYLIGRPVFSPNPTEYLLNFLTTPKITDDGPKRVWSTDQNDPTPVYDATYLDVRFDAADKDAGLALGNKVLDATGGRAQQCP